jgi:hypothetical protein
MLPALLVVGALLAAVAAVAGYSAWAATSVTEFPSGGTTSAVPSCSAMAFKDGLLTGFTLMPCDNSTTQDGPFVLLHTDPLFPNGKPIAGSSSVDVTEGASVVVALPPRGVAGTYAHATVTLTAEGVVTAASASTSVESFAGRSGVVVPVSGDYTPVLIPTGAGTLQDTINARFIVGQATPYLNNEAVLDFDPALFSVDDLGSSFAVTRVVKTLNSTILRPINLMVDPYGDFLSADEGPVPAAPNGLATLDGAGKLLATQIPASLLSSIIFAGAWNAANNTPTLTNGSCPQNNIRYVNVAGNTTLDGTSSWIVGDRIFCINGTTWFRLASPDAGVVMFAGRTGVVVPLAGDYTAAQVSATGGTVQTALNARILTVAPSPALPGQVAPVGTAGEIAITDLGATLQLSLAPFGVDGACAAAVGNVTITKGRLAAYSCITVVNSVFGRDGAVVAQAGDYTTAQITSVGGNTAADSLAAQFYVAALTSALSNEIVLAGSAHISLTAGVIDMVVVTTAGTATFLRAVTFNDRGQILSTTVYANEPVLTFNGRAGPAITPMSGDYTATQVTCTGGNVQTALSAQHYVAALTAALPNAIVLAGTAGRISLTAGAIDLVAVVTAGTTSLISSLTFDVFGRVTASASYATAPVLSFNGRTGAAITPTSGDYTATLVTATGGNVQTALNAQHYVAALTATLPNAIVLAGTAGRITLTAGALDLAPAGTAGTYTTPLSFVTDTWGRVTAATTTAHSYVLLCSGQTPVAGNVLTFSGSACWNSGPALPIYVSSFVATSASAASAVLVTQSTQALSVPSTGTYKATWSAQLICPAAGGGGTWGQMVVTIDGTQYQDASVQFNNNAPAGAVGTPIGGERTISLASGTRNAVFQVARFAGGAGSCTLLNAAVSLLRVA